MQRTRVRTRRFRTRASRTHSRQRYGYRPRFEALEARRLLAASPLGDEARVNAYTPGAQFTLLQTQAATYVAPDQTVIAFTGTGPQDPWGAYAQRVAGDGTRIGNQIRLNQTTHGAQEYASAAALPGGGFVAVWSGSGVGDHYGVFARRFDNQGNSLSGEMLVNTTTRGAQLRPKVSAAPDGRFVVAWFGTGKGDDWGVFARRFAADGTPAGAEIRVAETVHGSQHEPSVAMADDGSFVVVWGGTGKGDHWGVFARRFDAQGQPLGGEMTVGQNPVATQIEPSVAISENRAFVVSWTGNGPGDHWGVFASRFASDGSRAGNDVLVNQTTPGDQRWSSVAPLPEGGFVVAWTGSGRGDHWGVFAREFAANGLPVGDEVAVNTTTVGAQHFASVTANSMGDYSIAWSGFAHQDPLGVYARHFEQPRPEVPVAITSLSPAEGESLVNVARETTIQFSDPIDPATVTSDAFHVMALGRQIPGRVVVSSTNRFAKYFYDEPLPGSTAIRIVVEGDQILDAFGQPIDADGDGLPGGRRTADFTTLPLSLIPDTVVSGRVLQSNAVDMAGSPVEQPIAGVTIRLEGRPDIFAVTDGNGQFRLTSPAGLPAPDFFVVIDGSTATGVPDGFMYPTLGKPFHSIAGREVPLRTPNGQAFDIFLPLMNQLDIVTLDPATPTDVGFGPGGLQTLQQLFPGVDPAVWNRTRVNFQPGSARDDAGNPATQAAIVPVAPDRIPAPLPEFLNPELVISIQAGGDEGFNGAGGATQFDVPAEIEFPNLEGLLPGEQTLIFSFDHDAGRWIVVGTGTVSPDGLMIESDGGVIRAPGWHASNPGSPGDGDGDPPNMCSSDGAEGEDAACEPEPDPCDEDSVHRELLDETVSQDVKDALNDKGVELQPLGTKGFPSLGLTPWANYDNYETTIPASNLPEGFDVGDYFSNWPKNMNAVPNNADGTQTSGGKNFVNTNSFSTLDDPNVGDIINIDILGPQNGDVMITDISPTSFEVATIQGGQSGQHPVSGVREFGYIQHPDGSVTFYTRGVDTPLDIGSQWIGTGKQMEGWTSFLQGIAERFGISAEEAKKLVKDFQGQLDKPPSCHAGPGEGEHVLGHVIDFSNLGNRYYYRIFYAPIGSRNAPGELAGITDANGNFSEVISPDSTFTVYLYSPESQLFAYASGFSARSGRLTDFGTVEINIEATGSDDDGDLLPNAGEFVIGTDPSNPDSDGDGIPDGAELEQGLNPLDGFAAVTGALASLPLGASAQALDVAGNFVYVASGNNLTVVNVSQFDQPIATGQVPLPTAGRDVAVDGDRNLAVVSTGLAVQLIDVSDPMQPVLRQTVSAFAERVEVYNGFAYAVSGTRLTTIDLETGDALGRTDLPGNGNVTSLARVADKLFAYVSGSDTLVAIDLAMADAPHVIDSLVVSVASSDVGIFAGNDVLWLAGSGLRSVDISEPANLQVIQTPSGSQFFTARRIALNGSGLGLLLPDGGNFVQAYDTSDPDNVAGLITQFSLSGAARDVKISRGIGFIASGNGLDVVNYRPFDAQGQPPTVSISSPVQDVDPVTAGIQVLEGTTIPIVADVTDDVQARDVQLLVGGQTVSTDVSFPFDLTVNAPLLSSGQNQIDLQVRATDTGGNSTLSNTITIDIVADTMPPVLESVSPVDGGQVVEGRRTLRVRFSESLSEASVARGVFTLVGAGMDGQFDTADDVAVVASSELRDGDRLVQIATEPLAIGQYQLRIREDLVTDRPGNALGDGTLLTHFTVVEVPPIFQGTNPDVLFIVDVSGSTSGNFGGTPVGDLNGDGNNSDILDAEIAGLLVLNQEIINVGQADRANVGVIVFGSSARALDMDLVAGGDQFAVPPNADADSDANRDVEQVLTAIRRGHQGVGTSTNFEAALQAAIAAFQQLGTQPGEGNIVFLSDGTGSGSFRDEVATLRDDLGVSIRAFGVGPGASLSQLTQMDPRATRFSSTDELLDTLLGNEPQAGDPQTAPQAEAEGEFSSMDVNRDGEVAPSDVLVVLNYLNRPQPAPPIAGEGESPLSPARNLDVNEDGSITPADALAIINYLNVRKGAEGEWHPFDEREDAEKWRGTRLALSGGPLGVASDVDLDQQRDQARNEALDAIWSDSADYTIAFRPESWLDHLSDAHRRREVILHDHAACAVADPAVVADDRDKGTVA